MKARSNPIKRKRDKLKCVRVLLFAFLIGTLVWIATRQTTVHAVVQNQPTFIEPTAAPLGLTNGGDAIGLAQGDFNGDGKVDLAVTQATNLPTGGQKSFVSIFPGNGDGTFQAPTNLPIPDDGATVGSALGILAKDFSGDGRIDLVVSVPEQRRLLFFKGQGNGMFDAPTAFSTVDRSIGVQTADLNGDNFLDLVTVNSASGDHSVSVLLGNGDGTFKPANTFTVNAACQTAALVDLDGQNRKDIVLGCFGDGSNQPSIDVLLNNGSGVFQGVTTRFTQQVQILGLYAADFDDDSKIDVVVTGFGGPTNRSLLFLKGNGNGTFATPTEQSYQFIEDTPVGSTRFSENTLSDLNGDGRPDIIVDHGGALNIVTVALSRGDGHFDLQELAASNGPGFLQDIHGNTPTADGNNTNATIVSDVNGDGIPDLVVACGGAGGGTRAGGVSILPGLGQGKFLAPRGYPIKNDLHFHSSFSYAGNSERSTALGDFNGDNKLDLITLVTGGEGDAVGGAGHLAEVLPGNGDGTFGSAIVALAGTSGLGTGANTIRVADMNHDGKLDVIVTSGPAGVQGNSGTTATRIAYGVGNGTFTYAVALPPGDINWSISNVIVADFNNDNVLDLAVLTQHGFNGGAQKRQEHIEVFTQSTTQPGTFTLTAGFPQTDIGDSNGEGMVAGDFDGDGKVDLVAGGTGAPSGPDQIMFLKGKGDGSFQTPVAAAGITLFNGRIFDARALDLNGDGKLDLIAAGFGGVSVYLGNGNGTFQPPVSYGSGGGGSTKMEVADLDFDGKPDLALGSDNGLTILRGGGGSTFGAPIFFGIGHLGVRSLRIGDLNGDGKLDLAVGHDIQSSENIFLAAVINNFPTVEFSLANYNINEGVGSAVITVVRTGDTTSTSTVDYTTSDTGAANPCGLVNGVASSRCDYITTLGTLIFAPKEVSKTLTVPIVDDLYVEGDEVFNLVLSNPANAVLGTHGSATGTIKDNDTVIPTTNPIDVASFFVRQHYIDFLNREPDQDGLNFWTNEITSCGTNAQCIEVKRINVSGAFFLSIEFQQTGYLVERLYKTGYGDATGSSTIGGAHQLGVPIVRFNEFLNGTQRVGQGVVVLQPGWEQVLENNKQAFCAEFVQRQRFTDALPTTLTPTQFVDKLNQNAGNVLSTSERTAAINLFAGAGDSANLTARAQALRQVAEDRDLQNAEFNRAFVLMQYFGYLRRNPNDLPDTDYTGFDFWLTKLNQFNGNYQNAEMVKAFISSGEYRQRFGP